MNLKKQLISINSKLEKTDSAKKGYYDAVEQKTKIDKEIEKVEINLNNEIYELYGITKEKEIIENDLS